MRRVLSGYVVGHWFQWHTVNPRSDFRVTRLKRIDDGWSPNYVNNSSAVYGAVPHTPNLKSVANAVAAGYKRVAFHHTYVPTFRDKFAAFVKNVFIPHFISPKAQFFKRFTKLEWLATRDLTVAEKEQYLRIILAELPLTERQTKEILMFIKLEFYAEEEKAPRAVMPRCLEFRIEWGWLIYSLEQVIYICAFFVKHVPFADRAKFLKRIFAIGKVLANDFSSFESSTDAWVMWNVLFPIYSAASGGQLDEEIRAYLRALSQEVSFLYRGTKMRGSGLRTSGDMDTSLGNGIFNAVMICFYYYRCDMPLDTEFVVEGDDSLFRKGRKDPTQHFQRIGLTSKVEEHSSIEDASFCRVYCGSGVPITDAVLALCKLGWSNTLYLRARRAKLQGLLLAKCMSYVAQYNGCPIVSPICWSMIKKLTGREIQAIKPHDWWQREKFKQFDMTTELEPSFTDRKEYHRVFGLAPETQLQIEYEAQTWETDQDYIFSPTLLKMTPESWRKNWNEFTTDVDLNSPLKPQLTRIFTRQHEESFVTSVLASM